uniref:Uncharacterized protein n=1 Tax=Cajanus cajan TaxID=3821 RepID=A0A151TRA1_CAJCA|nr:hypothetical protein KK1_008707 [Cajanus cajan]
MKSFQQKGKETEELHQRFKKLELEWQTFKESKPTKVSGYKHTILKPHKRELMFNFQQQESPEEAWKNMTRTKDMAVQEILQERREAIESGKLKGRRLFHSPEEGETEGNVTRSHEVRSMSYYKSEDDNYIRKLSYSSSSSSFCGSDNDQIMEHVTHLTAIITEMEVLSDRRRGNGRSSYVVFFCWIAIILFVIAMCMSLAKSSLGENSNIFIVPT